MIQELSEEEKAAFAEAKGMVGASDEELAGALTVDDIPSPTFHASSGSKTAATAAATGVGLQLNFTDTAIWDSLKADLDKDARGTVNRYFDVDLENAEEVSYNNGKEEVAVMAYPITFVDDREPMVRGKKEEAGE